MRLTRIRLAGFKSFVDPTSVHFPSNLTGVVGPNGCGKSNIIDAVRWVMGELSARHLRGDSMADVIFNGSSARKPVGTASIELVFDNADGVIGGEYAGYAEVSLKRIVARDGTSQYLINGAKCRRKDITQLFLGTGLGSRSYAIIEQGMISRLIEAKPDELRAFLEEAAGISKYKERRRETENRIGHTRENLERLNDLREEVDKQIRHLQRQAATARRYQALKEDERKLNAEVLALRLRALDADATGREQLVREREIVMQAAIADQRGIESAIEKARQEQHDANEVLNEVQARYYQLGAQAARGEQNLQHARELRQRQRVDLEQVEVGIVELSGQLSHDQSQVDELLAGLAALTPRHETAATRERESGLALASLEESMQGWQAEWERFTAEAGDVQQRAGVEHARIEEIENRLRGVLERRERLDVELSELRGQEGSALEALSQREREMRSGVESLAGALGTAGEELLGLREEERLDRGRTAEAREELQALQGRLVSAEALQQAALGQVQGHVTEWLASHSLSGHPRLAQQLKVATGWERAVETVLGSYLEAVCVPSIDGVTALLGGLSVGQVTFVDATSAGGPDSSPQWLLNKVEGPAALASLLAGIVAVDTLGEAMKRRGKLSGGESIITRDGIWIGRDWLRVSRDRDTHAGVIAREQEIRQLRAEGVRVQSATERLERLAAERAQRAVDLEARRERMQGDANRQHQEHASVLAQLEAARERAGEMAARVERLSAESQALTTDTAAAEEAVRAARARLAEALGASEALEQRRGSMEAERDRLRAGLADARAKAQQDQTEARDVAIQLESRRSAQASTLAGLERMRAQLEQLALRKRDLTAQVDTGADPLLEMERALERALEQRLAVETELRDARVKLEAAEASLRALDERRLACETQADQARADMEQARLAAQEIRVRRESVSEQFAATHFELDAVVAGLPPEATVAAWEQTLTETIERIERLGSVNLAAIDEFREQSERKEYLDRQYADLTEALNTLESAIRKIDRETRQRFQDTFDRVNTGLKEKFPRLFGGGHAYLEMTGEDILSAGVAVMARPPGKRNSTIHLLSGGEKALTAVALVFSIFELNPAPFCLLDEVDAPLDDHNVGRFCEIVRDMSQRVQFIFITHNKATMELASQLIGVTMSEPGVSRLVSVDVDEAVRMAAM